MCRRRGRAERDLAKALVDGGRSCAGAACTGTLAPDFATETVCGVDAVIDATEPDLTVWLTLG